MIFTLNWLRLFLNTNCTHDEIAETLTNLGVEVEDVQSDRSEPFKKFKIVQIESCAPLTKKLSMCKVFDGNATYDVVCGASNVRSGMKTVFAPVGSCIPSNMMIIESKEIMGGISNGMLCSSQELCLENYFASVDGIIDILDDIRVGAGLVEYLNLDDVIFDVAITPDRPDLLSVYGIARLLAHHGELVSMPKHILSCGGNAVNIVRDEEVCSYFAIANIALNQMQQAPRWILNLLAATNLSTNIGCVDVINYVSHSLGHPMHVYDAGAVGHELYIRKAKNGESLDGLKKQISLDEGDVVVGNENEVFCLAGIMGSRQHSYLPNTKNIILESAMFDSLCINKTSQRLNLYTDSQNRFSKGVEGIPELALSFACNLLEQMGCTITGHKESGTLQQKRSKVLFEYSVINNILGTNIHKSDIDNILSKSGFILSDQGDIAASASVPSWRFDVDSQECIASEVARVYGYQKIDPIAFSPKYAKISCSYATFSWIDDVMVSLGYAQVISQSFCNSQDLPQQDLQPKMFVKNPVSPDANYIRPSIIPCLVNIAGKNIARQAECIRIFEHGPLFVGDLPEEELDALSCVIGGSSYLTNPHLSNKMLGPVDLKRDLERVFDYFNIEYSDLVFKPARKFWTFRGFDIELNGKDIGHFGAVSIDLLRKNNIQYPLYGFEIKLDDLKVLHKSRGNISLYPYVTRDLAFAIPSDMPIGQVVTELKKCDKVSEAKVFDIYNNQGSKSVGIRFTIMCDEKTLTNAEIDCIVSAIVDKAKQEFRIGLRI